LASSKSGKYFISYFLVSLTSCPFVLPDIKAG
jgi:hypothetical protein